jgi:hypothetical protein
VRHRAPLAWTAPDRTAWVVWDVRDGVRLAAGSGGTDHRICVRVADRWAFQAPVTPVAPAYPTDPSMLRSCLGRALDAGPLRRAHENDAAYDARRETHTAAWRAAQRAELERIWAATPRCAGACPTCDAQDAERDGGTIAPRRPGAAAASHPDDQPCA